MMMRIGKSALNTPSTKLQPTTPNIEASWNFSGTISIAGAANSANKIVTTRVMNALL